MTSKVGDSGAHTRDQPLLPGQIELNSKGIWSVGQASGRNPAGKRELACPEGQANSRMLRLEPQELLELDGSASCLEGGLCLLGVFL